MVRFSVCRHPAQGFFKRGVTLWINQARTIASGRLWKVPDMHFRRRRGFLPHADDANFWINKTFTTDATVIGLFRRSSPGARETVRHGESSHLRSRADSVCHRGRGDGHRQHEIFRTPAPFPGTRVVGTFIRIIILRTYITLTLPLLPFISSFMLSPPALREARRLPEVRAVRHVSYQSLRLSYLLNKTDCCLENVPDNM